MGTKHKINSYIERWESKGYDSGLPDDAPVQLEVRCLVPSYRKICIALMKNDNNLETLGISREKCQAYSEIKRAEIYKRMSIGKQLDLFYEKP